MSTRPDAVGAGVPDAGSAGPAGPRPAAFGPLFRLFLSVSAGRGRLVALAALGGVAVLVGVAIANGGGDRADRTEAWVRFASTFGLSLLAPVVALLLASASLGGPAEDGTLVYLWLRPVRRWRVAVAAALASSVVVAPLVLVPLGLGAALADTAGGVVTATALAHGVAVIAYTGLFTWLGLRVRRALPWGLAYILIWEGFVAAAGAGASRLAVRAYTRSILARLSGVELRLSDTPLPAAVAVPVLVGVVAVWLAGRRLARTDVP